MGFDAIVIGSGHNGLVAAARLGGAGRKILVLERRDAVGGLCAAREFHPGYTVPGVLHDTGNLRPQTIRELGLEGHGLLLRAEPPPIYAPAPGADGGGILVSRKPSGEVGDLPGAEAAAYASWRAFIERVRGPICSLMDRPPPNLSPASLADYWALAVQALALRRLGRQEMTEILRIAPMCVADWLNERFRTPLLGELLAAPAVIGTFMGPWSPGSAMNLLLHECTSSRHVVGGPAALITALSSACREAGVELRTGATVDEILLRGGRVAGVRLASGEEVDAPVVAASCDPKRTFLELLSPAALSVRVEQQFRRLRCRGTTAKVHLAVAGELELEGMGGRPLEAIRVGGGHLDALEKAFDAVKYRRFSEHPHLEIQVPTVASPELAPSGHHVVSILVSFAPHDLDGGWTDGAREALGDRVLSVLARHARALGDRLVAREVLTPEDLEHEYGLTGGQIHHGEHALDQLLFMRPAPCAARYGTPIPGLFLAGSGSHPGGGVTGMPGLLAAEAILASAEHG